MRRTIAALSIAAAGALSIASAGAADPYPTLKTGTTVVYDNWSYRIAEAGDRRAAATTGDGERFEICSVFARSGNIWPWERTNSAFYRRIDRNTCAQLEKLWPIEVGKSVRYPFIEVRGAGELTWYVKLDVVGKETLTVGDEDLSAYKVEEVGEVNVPGLFSRFKRVSWYSPKLGVVVKSGIEFTDGPLFGLKRNYALQEVRDPST